MLQPLISTSNLAPGFATSMERAAGGGLQPNAKNEATIGSRERYCQGMGDSVRADDVRGHSNHTNGPRGRANGPRDRPFIGPDSPLVVNNPLGGAQHCTLDGHIDEFR